MPIAAVNGLEIHYESVGEGFPVVFCHEFASNSRSFAAQVRHFARRYRVITWNYRGYPPSSVPSDPAAYSQDLVVDDLRGLLDGLSIAQAHIVGAATGSNVALNFAIGHPDRTRSLVVGGVGVGSFDRAPWLAAGQEMADDIARSGIDAIVRRVSTAPQRRALRIKDPKGWEEFLAILRELSAQGAELSMRGVMMKRKPVTELEGAIAALTMPLLVMATRIRRPSSRACSSIVRPGTPRWPCFPARATTCRPRSRCCSTNCWGIFWAPSRAGAGEIGGADRTPDESDTTVVLCHRDEDASAASACSCSVHRLLVLRPQHLRHLPRPALDRHGATDGEDRDPDLRLRARAGAGDEQSRRVTGGARVADRAS